jgi:uncharacterized membrane protein YdfJ with MMPL/SSD domain
VAFGREGLTVDVTEVIPRDGLRRRLGAALARRAGLAHVVIPMAAFLLGLTLSAVVFVGVWRHAASRSDRAEAAKSSADHSLRQTLGQVSRLQRTVSADRALLARARTARRALGARVAALETANRAVAARLSGQIDAVGATAATLARRSARLASALSSLQSYLAANPSTVDPGFLSAQARYLIGVSRAGEASASQLESQLGAVASTTSRLSRTR